MKILRIAFLDGADFCKKLLSSMLKDEYQLIDDYENPEIVIYSVFGKDYRRYSCKKLFITGENIFPNFNECDYAISTHYLSLESRHYRIPFYVFNKEYHLLAERQLLEKVDFEKKNFCSAIISNSVNSDPFRLMFLKRLHDRKQVTSVGRVFNTVGSLMPDRPPCAENLDNRLTNPDKIAFIRNFKFNFAFENSSLNGYCTEKITDAFISRTIPIYWGDPTIYSQFKKGSFINVEDFKTVDEAIDYILFIDSNQDEYNRMLDSFELLKRDYLDELKKFIEKAVEGPVFEHKYGYFQQYK